MKLFIIFSLCTLVLGDVDEKIVGGEETTIEAFPYQVSLRYRSQHICGGSIIDTRTIITAAHCVYKRSVFTMSVRVGSTTINNNNSYKEVHSLYKIIIHENYNDTSYNNDIAILKVIRPLKFNDRVRAVGLQKQGITVAAGTKAVVSGWGITQENERPMSTPRRLRKASVTVISRNECVMRYGVNRVTTNMLCAAQPGKDSCQGDSGGPLVVQNKLIGIVSWGIGCARPEYPGVYADISSLRSWIEKRRNAFHIW